MCKQTAKPVPTFPKPFFEVWFCFTWESTPYHSHRRAEPYPTSHLTLSDSGSDGFDCHTGACEVVRMACRIGGTTANGIWRVVHKSHCFRIALQCSSLGQVCTDSVCHSESGCSVVIWRQVGPRAAACSRRVSSTQQVRSGRGKTALATQAVTCTASVTGTLVSHKQPSTFSFFSVGNVKSQHPQGAPLASPMYDPLACRPRASAPQGLRVRTSQA